MACLANQSDTGKEKNVNIVDLLDRGLYALGALLRAPIVVLLWVCVLAAIALAGSVVADALARRRQRVGFDVRAWRPDAGGAGLPQPLAALYRDAVAIEDGTEYATRLEERLLQHETQARERALPAQVLVKVGPSIGLLGTLIPMGSALATLSQGNLEGMAGQMVAAFTSTIIGLATGTAGFVVAAQRLRWMAQDVRELRLLADLLAAERKP
jgi:biopolymer transport protein ExbB/TolQ